MLVGSLALAVGFAIYDLTVREIDLSAAASQSQYAIYAADTGVECALYWDSKAPALNGVSSIFATSTSGWSAWAITANSSAATTTFTLAIPNNGTPVQTYCAVVEVGKATISGVLYTTIISRGYNTCLSAGVTRLERTLQVSY